MGSERCLRTEPDIDLGPMVDELLGRPFRPGARGPEAYYCLGIWLDLLERATGIVIPDPFQKSTEEALLGFWRRFVEIPKGALEPLDILFWKWGRGEAHVATVEDDRWAVSITPTSGVHRIPLRDACIRAEAAYRLRELFR